VAGERRKGSVNELFLFLRPREPQKWRGDLSEERIIDYVKMGPVGAKGLDTNTECCECLSAPRTLPLRSGGLPSPGHATCVQHQGQAALLSIFWDTDVGRGRGSPTQHWVDPSRPRIRGNLWREQGQPGGWYQLGIGIGWIYCVPGREEAKPD